MREAFKTAVERGADGVAELFRLHPEARSLVDEPLFAFDAPAIFHAAWRNDRQLAELLLDSGADINIRTRWWAGGFGVLDYCDAEMAEWLISRGAVVDVHAAARLGKLERLTDLVAADPALVHARGGDGKTPLHFAGTPEVAAYLLDRGAEIDARDIDHESTPAQYLVREHPDVVRYLVSRGCHTDLLLAAAIGDMDLVRKHIDQVRIKVDAVNFAMRNPHAGGHIYIWTIGQNRTPHQVAANAVVRALLMEHSPPDVRIYNAFAVGDAASIGADPDAVAALRASDPQLVTRAAEDNNTQAVRLLLEHGWPVEGGRARQTPLHWAAWNGNVAMVEIILRHNPPLEQRDLDFNGTPLRWAEHGSQNGRFRDTGDYPATMEALQS